MSSPTVAVITGQPGVGKSTTCARLASRRTLAAHVKADDLHRMIVTGGEWPSAATAMSQRQLLARTRSAAQVAHTFAAAGTDVFIDEVVALPEQLDILDCYVGPAHWVLLTASPAVVTERDALRAKHTASDYLHVGAALEGLLAGRATFIDTDRLDAGHTVDLVEAALSGLPVEPDARGPVWWLVEVNVDVADVPRFEALTREMLAQARLEDGTLTYERFRVDETTFHFHERYESSAAALRHLEQFQLRFADQLSGVIRRRRFHLYGPASPQLRTALEPLGATAATPWPMPASA